MKFELNPYNYGLSDEELLNDLRSVAERLHKNFVTRDEYDKMGRLCSTTLQKRFGSWRRANGLAGLKRKALEAFVASFESQTHLQKQGEPDTLPNRVLQHLHHPFIKLQEMYLGGCASWLCAEIASNANYVA